MNRELSTFYSRWIAANALAEAIGLGGTFVLGFLAAPYFESESVISILATAFAAVILGALLEGVVVGVAQSIPLGSMIPAMSRKSWITATAVGAGLAWFLGMIPSTTMALMTDSPTIFSAAEPSAIAQYALAALLGVVAGPILGIAQWFILRKQFSGAITWLGANAAAWSVGMPVIFIGMEFVPWNADIVAKSVAIVLVCFVAGLVVGAIHGWFLVRLIHVSRCQNAKER